MEEDQLVGTIDIVAAFTALRQDVKTQIRGGRELQEVVAGQLGELDRRLQSAIQHIQQLQRSNQASSTNLSAQATSTNQPSKDEATSRQLAEALAEVEEAMQRAVQAIPEDMNAGSPLPALVGRFDELWGAKPWWLPRSLARKLDAFHQELKQAATWQPTDVENARQGLKLTLARIHRVMKQCALERMDVLGRAFDAETMFAIDTIASTTTPSAHVAEQIRPAYLWQGKLLRSAEVRLAK